MHIIHISPVRIALNQVRHNLNILATNNFGWLSCSLVQGREKNSRKHAVENILITALLNSTGNIQEIADPIRRVARQNTKLLIKTNVEEEVEQQWAPLVGGEWCLPCSNGVESLQPAIVVWLIDAVVDIRVEGQAEFCHLGDDRVVAGVDH